MSCELCPLVVGQQTTRRIEVYDETLDIEESFEVCDEHANQILEKMEYYDKRDYQDGTTYCYAR